MKLKSFSIESIMPALFFISAGLLTLWRFGANQCLALICILVLCHQSWRQQLFDWKRYRQPILLFALIFMAWAILSLSYSQAPTLAHAAEGLTMYSKLLFLLAFPLALDSTKSRTALEQGLIWGVLINVFLSTAYYFQVPWVLHCLGPRFYLTTPQIATYSINPIEMIYVVVMACWILAQRMAHKKASWQDISCFIVLSLYLWVINIERSGYLLYLILLFILLIQYQGKKGALIGLLIIPLWMFMAYEFIPHVKMRCDIGKQNLQDFHEVSNVKEVKNDNSLGLRLRFAKESWDIIKAHPLLGTGIGSFKYVYKQKTGLDLHDPHNAYTLVFFELGLIGGLLYLAWLGSILKSLKHLPREERYVLQGLFWAFIILGFVDENLSLNAMGISFIMLLSLYGRSQLIRR